QEVARLLRMSPLPAATPDETNRFGDDERAAALGHRLFFDPRLSSSGTVSCATCHDPAQAFTDGRSVAHGVADGTRNTPTILNASLLRWYFWDGRVDTQWAQALVPVENPLEMDFDRVALARVIHDDAALRVAYEAIFGAMPDLSAAGPFPARARPGAEGDPLNTAWMRMSPTEQEAIDRVFANFGKSMAAYERRLRTGPAPFDRFVEGLRTGDESLQAAIGEDAKRGARLFVGTANCRLCHNGPMLSDGEFHSIGLPPLDGGPLRDQGRYAGAGTLLADPFNATGAFSDDPNGPRAEQVRTLRRSPETWGQFRTPSLREVARTAPYGHQGQIPSLRDFVLHYSTMENAVFPGHHRETILMPLGLSEQEVRDLVAFLETLSGELPPEGLRRAPAPGSSDR
ncbi:MAG: c-type cytochrome, partial [Phycisphaerales bacterium]|nr:c-type cytochrome [Phycisphaerales bacterium]